MTQSGPTVEQFNIKYHSSLVKRCDVTFNFSTERIHTGWSRFSWFDSICIIIQPIYLHIATYKQKASKLKKMR